MMGNDMYQGLLKEQIEERLKELRGFFDRLGQETGMRKQIEAALMCLENELKEKQIQLEDMNRTLRVLLGQKGEERMAVEDAVIMNISSFVMPYLEKLKVSGLSRDQIAYCSGIEEYLNDITSAYLKKLTSKYVSLSPSEIKVAALIRDGKCSKEIANILGVSVYTVTTHRYHIRRKLGLRGKDINLRTYLRSEK